MRSDRQTNEGLWLLPKMLTSWKKKAAWPFQTNRRQKRQNSCIPMSGPRLIPPKGEMLCEKHYGFTWEIWNTGKQIRYKYIQVTEAECYTIDMDKNIPTRIYTDRLSGYKLIFAPSWGETVHTLRLKGGSKMHPEWQMRWMSTESSKENTALKLSVATICSFSTILFPTVLKRVRSHDVNSSEVSPLALTPKSSTDFNYHSGYCIWDVSPVWLKR